MSFDDFRESHPVQVPVHSAAGLTSAEAAQRMRSFGPNLPPRRRPFPIGRRLLAQLVHFFALMLWVAGGLAVLAGMPQLGVAIFVVILLNALFAFLQEYRAERTSERLRELLPRHAMVIRNGRREEIDAAELVPDDVVFVQAGDRISADMLLAEVRVLSVDTSMLSGESVPTTPQVGEAVFAGTFALEGEGVGVVTQTGSSTRIAQIAELTAAIRRPASPLAIELDRVVRAIAAVSLSVGLIFLAIALLVGLHSTDGLLFALGVTVALVPEGLLPTVTLSLAIGAQRMAARGALVRRLESVETLGSTTFICTDKTGTLTRNEMSVVEIWTPSGGAFFDGRGYAPEGAIRGEAGILPAIREMALAAVRCSTGRIVQREGRWIAQGDPLDAALDAFARSLKIEVQADETAFPSARRIPFDRRRQRVSVVVDQRLLVKGAPEAVFGCCREIGGAEAALERMAQRGLRVIAVAARALYGVEALGKPEAIETNLTLLGLIGIEDPPRDGVSASIDACRKAGIRIAMVTGDHPETARAIARKVGLFASEEVVLEGKDLPQDEDALGTLVDRDGIVVSRVSPEKKLRIARALRKRGHVVAMTGDGVNDAPALQQANIGIAMGLCGTDVAREAADLVLLDDNFATIVDAIEQGRTTFVNARRFLAYHLTDNVAELMPFVVWALSAGRFPLALGVLQILCLDIGTDILPAIALGAEPSRPGVLGRLREGRHLVDFPLLLRAFCVLGLTESIVEMAAFVVALIFAGWRPGLPFPSGPALLAASGAAFTAVVAGQVANAFACRSGSVWPGKLGWFTNRYLIGAIVCELAMLAGFLYISPLARMLGQKPPNAAGCVTALLAIPAVLGIDALQKQWKVRRQADRVTGPVLKSG